MSPPTVSSLNFSPFFFCVRPRFISSILQVGGKVLHVPSPSELFDFRTCASCGIAIDRSWSGTSARVSACPIFCAERFHGHESHLTSGGPHAGMRRLHKGP